MEQIRRSDEQARQGKAGVGLRYVLLYGLILVVIAFAIVYGIMSWL